jgi:4-amino-4-deoxy-L-arabinose transferase-like glycosyltransferase
LTAPETHKSWLVPCAALITLAAAIRVVSFLAAPPLEFVGDELYYTQVARNLAQGDGHVFHERDGLSLRAWRPPGQPLAMAGALGANGASGLDASVRSAPLVLALQIALGSLLAGATGWLGLTLVDRRTGWIAGLLCATYPSLIAFSHYAWSETLTALLLTSALAAATGYARAPGPLRALCTGLLLGSATLVREVAFAVLIVVCWWWWREAPAAERARALRHAGLALAVAVLCIAPWTLRNARQFDRLVPVSTIGWFAIAEGNTFEADDWLRHTGSAHLDFNTRYFSRPTELERSDFARAWALEHVRSQQPLWLAKKLVRNGALLLSPDSYLLFKQAVGSYGDVRPSVRTASLAAVSIGWGLAAALGAWGIAIAATPARRLGLAVLAIPLALHLLSNATSRFRIPWLGLWLVFAALGALELPRLRERWVGLRPAGRWVLLGFIGFVFAVAFPYFAEYGGRR